MMIQELWLIHRDDAMCAAFRQRFAGLAGVTVSQSAFEDLSAHDCFVTAGNSFGIMTVRRIRYDRHNPRTARLGT